MANCCPDKRHHCKGMCEPCYQKQGYERRRQDPAYRAAATERTKKWAVANPDRVYELDANKHLVRKFGITLEQYKMMYERQGGVCKLCNKPESGKGKKRVKRLAVDHCHTTGAIRGLLCFKCNTSIAIVEEDLTMLGKIKSYLGVTL